MADLESFLAQRKINEKDLQKAVNSGAENPLSAFIS